MNEILEKLRTEGPALSQRVLDDMYADPFWTARFGDKGRRHANEDSDFHLRYLGRAIAAGDPAVMVRYARWLREVLATRGMCTRHLDDNFRRLSELVVQQRWPGGDLAAGFLQAARESLRWEEGPAAALQADAARVEAEIAKGALAEPARDLVSYLIDALALQRHDLFAAHVRWMQSHLAGRGIPAADWRAVVAALEGALSSAGMHSEALECVRAAAH